MRSSESGLGCSIRTSNCLATSPKRMGVSFTGFAMFHLAFVQGYNVPFRKHVYLTKNLLLKSNGLETTSQRLSLRFFPRAADARSAGGAAVCGIMRQFAAEDGVVLGTIDWAMAADALLGRQDRCAGRRKGASPTNTQSGKKLGVYKFGFRNKSEEKERDGRTTAPFFFLATPYQSNLYTSIFL